MSPFWTGAERPNAQIGNLPRLNKPLHAFFGVFCEACLQSPRHGCVDLGRLGKLKAKKHPEKRYICTNLKQGPSIRTKYTKPTITLHEAGSL